MKNTLSIILNIHLTSNLAVIALHAAPGDLDLALDFDGIVTTRMSMNNAVCRTRRTME